MTDQIAAAPFRPCSASRTAPRYTSLIFESSLACARLHMVGLLHLRIDRQCERNRDGSNGNQINDFIYYVLPVLGVQVNSLTACYPALRDVVLGLRSPREERHRGFRVDGCAPGDRRNKR
jgi:hypothetical protein